jgi:hypothetical protein
LVIRRPFQCIFTIQENGFAGAADYFVGHFQGSSSRVRDFAAVLWRCEQLGIAFFRNARLISSVVLAHDWPLDRLN